MNRFDNFIKVILRNEGGLANDPSDSGGLTKYGISKAAYPNVDIRNLTLDDAEAIYKRDYYDPCKIDQITDSKLALHVFDFAVNAGVGRAIKHLQQVAGVTPADGLIGRITLARVNSGDYLNAFVADRKAYYRKIAVGKNAKFLPGWLHRVDFCSAAIKL
jgi:lysozyme family protein